MSNPRYKNGNRRRKMRARFKAMQLPCAICGRPIDYEAPSNSDHPLSFVLDEDHPVSRWREFGYSSPSEAAQDWDNVQAVHWICNAKKSNNTTREIRRKMNQPVIKNVLDGNW